MVLVEVDGNYIDAEPMKNKSARSMVKSYIELWTRLTAKGVIRPTTHLLDNEVSAELKAEIIKNCTIQLVPSDNHRRSLAERAIQTFKNHFKAILAGVDDSFPMQLWDKLLPQTVLTLNLLRQLNVAPTVSAYQYVHGNFDYNKMPLAPMGCVVQLYESINRRETWADNSTDGWYLGTSNKHYRCHIIYVKKTRSKRISDTVFFKHRYITQPTLMQADIIVKAIDDLTYALKGRKNVKSNAQIEALEKIDELLNNIPKKISTVKQKHVTPNENTQPTAQSEKEVAIVDKPIPVQTPISRVQKNTNIEIAAISPLTPRVHSKSKEDISPKQMNLCHRIREATQARLPHCHNMQLRQQEQHECVQLIQDDKMGEYLNY